MTKRPGLGEMEFSAKSIHELQESEDIGAGKALKRLLGQATTAEIIAVLAETEQPDVLVVLCYELSRRCDPEAVPVLVRRLYYPEESVCTLAAEALGNIGDVSAGPSLLEQFCGPTICNKSLLAYAIGAVGYRPAIPILMQAFQDADSVFRGSLAVAFGLLGATEAAALLESALDPDLPPTDSARKLIERASSAIYVVTNALEATDKRSALPHIVQALEDPDPMLSHAAVWALHSFGDEEAEKILQNKLSSGSDSCSLMQRIKDALNSIRTNDPRNSS